MAYMVSQGSCLTVAVLLDHLHLVHYQASAVYRGSFATPGLPGHHTTAAAAAGDEEAASGSLYFRGLLNLVGSPRLDPQTHSDRGKGGSGRR